MMEHNDTINLSEVEYIEYSFACGEVGILLSIIDKETVTSDIRNDITFHTWKYKAFNRFTGDTIQEGIDIKTDSTKTAKEACSYVLDSITCTNEKWYCILNSNEERQGYKIDEMAKFTANDKEWYV
jgi:hypothetical protein